MTSKVVRTHVGNLDFGVIFLNCSPHNQFLLLCFSCNRRIINPTLNFFSPTLSGLGEPKAAKAKAKETRLPSKYVLYVYRGVKNITTLEKKACMMHVRDVEVEGQSTS